MNPPELPEEDLSNATHEEIMSAIFANTVIQQANMALMFLGQIKHPETGQLHKDLEASKMFIDQLEMLEFKTKGNLNDEEKGILQESLNTLRMMFVQEMEGQASDDPIMDPAAGEPRKESPTPAPPTPPPSSMVESPDESDSRKKFTKKY